MQYHAVGHIELSDILLTAPCAGAYVFEYIYVCMNISICTCVYMLGVKIYITLVAVENLGLSDTLHTCMRREI